LRTRTWLAVVLALTLLIGCSPKVHPSPTLAPTLALPTAAPPTPSPPPTPTMTPLPTPTEVPLAASVNGQPILLADLEREATQAGDAATRQQVLNAMIETLLLEQAATAAGIAVTDDELNAIVQADVEAVGGQEVFRVRLESNHMTEKEYRDKVRAGLLAQRVQIQVPQEIPASVEHVHARHILVAAQEEAQAILAQLREGADFAALAQTYSLDVSTRDRGGDLGFFPRGLLLTPEVEEAAFALAPGQISDVVHSELLGYHIVQALEREERLMSEQDRELVQANLIRQWRERLWASATIERYVEP